MNCEYCLQKFNSDSELYTNNKKSELYLKYRHVSFTCLKCNFSTIGIDNIDKHLECCNKDKDDDNNSCEIEETPIEIKQLKNSKSTDAKILLRIEKKIDTLIKNNNNFCLKNDQSQNSFSPTKIICLSPKKSNKSKSPETGVKKTCRSYRIIKKSIDIVEEPNHENRINEINAKNEIIKKQFILKIKESECIFNECFKILSANKATTNIFNETLLKIKNTRLEIIEYMSSSEYCKLLKSHIKMLETICKDNHYMEKKTNNIILKSLNTLDTRFIFFKNYTSITLETDEISKYKNSLYFFNKSKSYYSPFDQVEIFTKFHNFSLAISTIKESIERYLFNSYGFNNIIYIPLKQSTDEDPFSFYILESVEKETRFWKMDCRLEQFCNNFIENIKNYLIVLFKKIYFDIFEDNDYRSNYADFSPVADNECKQILQNLYLLNDTKEFSYIFRNSIKQNAFYNPTENDKFNMYSDDIIQKKRFLSLKNSHDIIDIIKLLFDKLTTEQAVDFYRND